MTGASVLLALVTAERLAELWLAARNTAALKAQGALEHGAAQYPVIVALHVLWLAGLWTLGWTAAISLPWLAVFVVLQALRVWVLATLGPRWTTRIIVLPGAALVQRGPYRFLSHPNYAVVVGEIAVLPLALGMPVYALMFSVLNGFVLWSRIRAENAALGRDAPV